MEESQIITGVVDVLTGKMTYEFTVKVRRVLPVEQPKRTLLDKLLRKPLPALVEPETERHFKIYPSVVINQYRIAGKAVSLPKELFDDATKMLAYVPVHLPAMCYIIAAAIQNNDLEPDPELISFLEKNLDNADIMQILGASLQGVNMLDFSSSIILMNAEAAILEMSPKDGSE